MSKVNKSLKYATLFYACSSLTLFMFPSILHKRKDSRVMINRRGEAGTLALINCAHRCGSAEGFENTV